MLAQSVMFGLSWCAFRMIRSEESSPLLVS